ncbi:MAG: response regulator transcription factor [Chloroflexi bacterium]|nr:response regulator transcription factor [Chloroflexota bacterium]
MSVLLVDSQVLFRQGILRLLSREEDIQILADTGEVEEAMAYIEGLAPQVVLLDSNLSNTKDVDLAEVILRHYPGVAVVLLAEDPREQEVCNAMSTGVAARLSRKSTAQDMADVIRRVSRGELTIVEDLLHNPGVAPLVMGHFQRITAEMGGPSPLLAPLTSRETDILTQLDHGRSGQEIAESLQIENGALRKALLSVLFKLAVNRRTMNAISSRLQGPGG